MKLLEHKLFFPLKEPQGVAPDKELRIPILDMNGIQKKDKHDELLFSNPYKIWRNDQKIGFNWSKEENNYIFAQVSSKSNVGMRVPYGYIIIDVDDMEQSNKVLQAINDQGLKCIISNTGKGKHFMFKDPKKGERTQSNGLVAIGGLKIDSRIHATEKDGVKKQGGYVAVKFSPDKEVIPHSTDGMRFVNVEQYNLEDLSDVPIWLEPIKFQSPLAKEICDRRWEEGSRDNDMMLWVNIILKSDASKAQTRKVIWFIDQYMNSKPVFTNKAIFESKVNNWIDHVDKRKVNNYEVDSANPEQDLAAYNVIKGLADIDYIGFTEWFKEQKNIVFFTGSWWIKADKPWHEKIPWEILYEHFIDMTGNVAITKVKEKDFMQVLKKVCRRLENDDDNGKVYVLNGVYDIKTRKLSPHEDGKFLTFGVSINYNVAAHHPETTRVFKQWTENRLDEEAFLYQFIGSMFTSDNDYSQGVIVVGTTAGNGKTDLIATITGLIDDEYIVADQLSQVESRFGLESMIGKRVWLNAELDDKYIEKSPNFKKLVGSNDILSAELKHVGGVVKFKSSIKFLGATNRIMRFDDQTNGIYRRITLLHFSFEVSKLTPKEKKEYNKYFYRSKESKEYLLRKGLEGLSKYMEDKKMIVPKRSKKLVDDMKKEGSPVLQWVNDFDGNDSERMKVGETLNRSYVNYKLWCSDNRYKYLGLLKFKSELERVSTNHIWYRDSEKHAYYLKLKPKTQEELEKELENE